MQLSGPTIKRLNKETVSWALLDALNLPDEVIGEIVEIVWRSDELLEAHQNYVSRVNADQQSANPKEK